MRHLYFKSYSPASLLVVLLCMATIHAAAHGDHPDRTTGRDGLLKNMPVCPEPVDPRYSFATHTSVRIDFADGRAEPDIFYYEVRLRDTNGPASWRLYTVTDDHTITINDIDEAGAYVFQVRKVCISPDRAFMRESAWVAVDPETLEDSAFSHTIRDTLLIWLEEMLMELKDSMQDSIDARRIFCDDIREDMEGLMDILKYDRDFIFGEKDEYFEEGMHRAFSSEPQPFMPVIDRNPHTVALENRHIDLYHCDKTLGIDRNLYDHITEMQEKEALGHLADRLLEKTRQFTAGQVSQYRDMEAFVQWLKDEVLGEIDREYKTTHGFMGITRDNELLK